MDRKRVGIVGAGAGGLAAIKACLEEGFTPVAFERTDQLGKLHHQNVKSFRFVLQYLLKKNSRFLLKGTFSINLLSIKSFLYRFFLLFFPQPHPLMELASLS